MPKHDIGTHLDKSIVIYYILSITGSSSVGRVPALGAGCRRFESCLPDSQGEVMEENKWHDVLSWIFLFVVVVLFFFATYNKPKESLDGLQGGDIDRAIREQQYR